MTPLEALAAGVPPVLLDTPVARESCGDAALYVPLGDLSATTRALESVLFDDATRARLLAAAPAALASIQWPRAARDTLAVIEQAAAMTQLSIIIVSFNARDELERCLDVAARLAAGGSHEIVVVDNGSSDGSAAAAQKREGVQVIENGANLGFARANNAGIRASIGANLLLLNSDTLVPPGAIDLLLAELDATRRRRRRSAPGGCERPRRALVRPYDRPAQRIAAAAARGATRIA